MTTKYAQPDINNLLTKLHANVSKTEQSAAKKWQERRHLLTTQDLSLDELSLVMALASAFKANKTHKAAPLTVLANRTIANLFYENSTRTRSSFELAARKLGATVLNLDLKTSSVAKGESLKDTALNLWAMGVDAIVMRHSQSGVPQDLADQVDLKMHVINAGDGWHSHPSQGLLDIFTILESLGRLPELKSDGRATNALNEKSLAGLKVAIIGDIMHSRVARSDMHLITRLGGTVAFAGPPALMPDHLSDLPGVSVSHRLHDALQDAHIVICLRLQLERQEQGLIASLDDYKANYRIDHDRLRLASPQVKVLHPGPINRGLEITDALADDQEYSLILEQVQNGVLNRMDALYLLLGGSV